MNIYDFLSAGKWVAFRKIEQLVYMSFPGKPIQEGELVYSFNLDLIVTKIESGVISRGTYKVDGDDYSQGKGHMKLITKIGGEETVWEMIPSDVKTSPNGEVLSATLYLTRYSGEFEFVFMFNLKK